MKTANVWKKVGNKRIADVQNILKVLVAQYDKVLTEKNESHEFRRTLSKTEDLKNVQIYIREFGQYEYLIYAEVDGKSDSWIHVDGISEERKFLKDKKDHPVHTIVCMTDIYRSARVYKNMENKLAA